MTARLTCHDAGSVAKRLLQFCGGTRNTAFGCPGPCRQPSSAKPSGHLSGWARLQRCPGTSGKTICPPSSGVAAAHLATLPSRSPLEDSAQGPHGPRHLPLGSSAPVSEGAWRVPGTGQVGSPTHGSSNERQVTALHAPGRLPAPLPGGVITDASLLTNPSYALHKGIQFLAVQITRDHNAQRQ